MMSDIIFRFGGPISRYLRAFQRITCRLFRDINGILQHDFLPSMQSGREPGITSCERIVADPKIHATVGRQKNGIASDEIIVDPTGRSAHPESEKQKRNRA